MIMKMMSMTVGMHDYIGNDELMNVMVIMKCDDQDEDDCDYDIKDDGA